MTARQLAPNILVVLLIALSLWVVLGDRNFKPTATEQARDWGDFGRSSDVVLGDPDAPISILEYASVTCSHCATFHEEVFPQILEKFIDTGSVRFAMRPLPTAPQNMAYQGFMVAACVPEDRYYDFIGTLMRHQTDWAFPPASLSLQEIAAQAGISGEQFQSCSSNGQTISQIRSIVDEARSWGIGATPTFFINGVKYEGVLSFDRVERIVQGQLED